MPQAACFSGDVAIWMAQQLETSPWLYQEMVVYELKAKFGDQFTYLNASGNLAIGKPVLAQFKRITGDAVVWEGGSKAWRKRSGYDRPGRKQD